MNYYEHHIGDYAEATAHLSILEDGAYRRLISKYYAIEKALPSDVAACQRLIGARSKEEREAVESVLKEFFTLEADGWHQKTCDENIAKYLNKLEKARASANARWSKSQSDGNANASEAHMRTESERNANASKTHNGRNALQSPDSRLQSPNTNQEKDSALLSEGKVSPAGEMAVALRALGVQVTSQHPLLLGWIRDGFTTQKATDATALARMRKPYPEPIPAAYLDRVLRSPPPSTAAPPDTRKTKFDQAMENLDRA